MTEEKKDEKVQDEQEEIETDSSAKLEECLTNWKRALADYDNLKKEMTKEREEIGRFAQAMAGMRFIEVYENFKKAFGEDAANSTNEQWVAWKKGIEHIKNQFADVLKQMGIEEIKTIGEKFNPACHEAVGEEKVEDKEAGKVVREIEGGYKIGEKVLKAAKVIVT